MKNEERDCFLILRSHLEPRTSSSNLSPLNLLLQLQNPVHEPLGRRRASRHPDIHRDHFIDALHDLANLTFGHEERLGDVVAGYGSDVDLDLIRAWWSMRSLLAVRWLIEHGFDPSSPGCEFAVLRSQM